ncbi:hypothetical protein [Streptomyces nojiriensis]|uniref:hypothetical protein n=1 Tax=Streptomyces nojiriensis TaxID=66374 RepID=UPI001672E807|nr:hypothetical protein [Streptomyces nojiriensis]
MPQPVGNVDGVGPDTSRPAATSSWRARSPTGVVGRLDTNRGGQIRQPDPLGEHDQRQQPGIRDQIRLAEERGDTYLGRALSIARTGSLTTPNHRRSQGSSSFPEKLSTGINRWIRAEPNLPESSTPLNGGKVILIKI